MMLKFKFTIVAMLIMSANAMATLVDDFDSYAPGQVNAVTTQWIGTDNIMIEVDPTDAANNVIGLYENGIGIQAATYGILSSDATIAEGETKTLFLRFRATETIDSAFGLTQVDTPDVGGQNWGDFNPQVSVNFGNFRVRDSGSFLVTGPYTPLEWYNLWMVVDNATDTMKVYLHNRPSEAATEADLVTVNSKDTFGFRNATTNDLDRFYWRGQFGSADIDRQVLIDDIYMMDGESHSNPLSKPSGQKITWVADNLHYDFATGLPADHGFVELLRAQGYQVDYKGEFDPHVEGNDEIPVNPDWLYWRELDPNKIAELNAADLVIIARDPASSTYDDGNEPAEWNSITTPMIMQSAHIARTGGKWGWLNSTQTVRSTDANAVVVDPIHPIFDGVTIDSNNMVNILTGGWNVDWANTTDVGNGTLLATRPDGVVWIAEWAAGQEFFEGSGQAAGGPRMFFACGSGSSNPVGDGTYNLSADGEIMFLNAVKYMLPIQPVDPGTENLVVSYSLDGDVTDSSGNGYDGTIMGDPEFVEGIAGMAMEFDGDDYVDTGYTEDLATWTISAWIKSPAAPAAGSSCGPIHRENNYQFNWNHFTPSWRGSVGTNIGDVWYSASFGILEANTWYHLIGTYDGENLKAYKDGILITVDDSPSGDPMPESNSLKLARHAASERFFTGTIDEVRIFNRALSDAEILYLASN
jgi:hypothetical protein